jgi:hypothetical protein
MYRRGLSAARIAVVCNVSTQKVRRALSGAKRSELGLEQEHQSNVPKPSAPSPRWTRRCEELTDFVAKNGRLPFAKGHGDEESSLARWLAHQRSASALNDFPQEKRRALAATGDWESTPRSQKDALRWEERLDGVAAFVAQEGRYPSYRRASSEIERLLGTWLHIQRQAASHSQLAMDRLQAINDRVPGWNTWKSVPSTPSKNTENTASSNG